MGWFKNVAKWIVTGAGTVLSLVNPALGAPLLVLGKAMPATGKSVDAVNTAAANLGTALTTANAMTAGANVSTAVTSTADTVITWVKNNIILVAGIVLGLLILPKLLFRKK